MQQQEGLIKDIRAAFEREPRINVHEHPVEVGFREGALVLEGEVDTVAAKKRALDIVRAASEAGIDDRLRVIPLEPKGDGAIRDNVVDLLLDEPTLRNCALACWNKGQRETLREMPVQDPTEDPSGNIVLRVEDGVVTLEGEVLSLSHQRLAGAIAWWVPGVRDVANRLSVVPPEEDTDDELIDAVMLVLDKDILVPSSQLHVTAQDGVIILEGLLREPEARRAEFDAWCIHGVRDVVNRIELEK